MDLATARVLSDLTSDFYKRVSSSFSDTRTSAWEGWHRVLDVCADACRPDMRVLDLGCGNLRFERFLAQEACGFEEAYAVDCCDELAAEGIASLPSAYYQHLDIARTLLGGRDLTCALHAPKCDLAAAFGLMHHLPLPDMRLRVLQALAAHTRQGGYVVASFWQFAHSDKLRAKAEEATARGCATLGVTLDAGDYLMGWQSEHNAFRFCHHFEESEIDGLSRALAPVAQEVARFSADGKTGDLNRYLVLHVIA